MIACYQYKVKLLTGFRVFDNKLPTIGFNWVLVGLTNAFWVFIILLCTYILCIQYYIWYFMIAYHCYISIHLIHAQYLLIGQVHTVCTYFCTFSNANIFTSRAFLGNLECTIVFSTLELYCIHLLSTIIVYNLSSYRSSKFTIAKTQKRLAYLTVKSYDINNSTTTMNQQAHGGSKWRQ